ncbi:IS110 family transposase [Clostridia bacterium]|nr:IS110 family transposase [Clostridia bacterium]
MNVVGIDVSKGKSTAAAVQPLGKVVISPYEVAHTTDAITRLVERLGTLSGETKVVMEYTSMYFYPIAAALHEAGMFVSIVHSKLIHDYNNDTIRRIKTDPKDALKIANYGLDKWLKLRRWLPEEDLRKQLKLVTRQYWKYSSLRAMLINNFKILVEQTFPGVSDLFTSGPRKSDGHEKWHDFAMEFWHCECVRNGSPGEFDERYLAWCKANHYSYKKSKAEDIYMAACGHPCLLPKDDTTQFLIQHAIKQLNAVSESKAAFAEHMKSIAEQLPEYPIVMGMQGVGELLGPQLMAEIGNIRRFNKKGSLVCYAGLESPPFQSGKFEAKSRSVSKKGSPHLRRTLFQVMIGQLQRGNADDPVFNFLDRKRAEGKNYYCYMTAGCTKFLRIYYARVKEYLEQLEVEVKAEA